MVLYMFLYDDVFFLDYDVSKVSLNLDTQLQDDGLPLSFPSSNPEVCFLGFHFPPSTCGFESKHEQRNIKANGDIRKHER